MRKTIAGTLTGTAALASAVLAVALAAPATAASTTVADPQDASGGSDLTSVRVTNGDRNVVVVTSHDNLRRDPQSGASGVVYVDTDRADRGPEFVFVGGFFEGTDYQLLRTEGFAQRSWGARVHRGNKLTLDFAGDRARIRLSRAALGNPGRVRVAVRISAADGSVDWLGERRSFTSWVGRG